MIEPMSEARETHDLSGLDCWCGPRYIRPCDECGVPITATIHCDDFAAFNPTCWKCEGGTIALTREEAQWADCPLIIVHKEFEE